MSLRSKKVFFFVLGAILFVVIALSLRMGRFFEGAIRLAFFRDAPTQYAAVQQSYLPFRDAVSLLVQSAEQAGRIDREKAQQFLASLAPVAPEAQMTREQFALWAVSVFDVASYGKGPLLTDVSADAPAAAAIAQFVSYGGVPLAFKPQQFVTRSFAEQAVAAFRARFSSGSN